MSAEFDMSQYLDLFMQESEEQLEILETEMIKLEEDPSSERLQLIFRAAHTLKGSSRAMGFIQFADVTHEMENILDKLRNNELEISTEIADGLLSCIDCLLELRDLIADTGKDDKDCQDLVKKLQSFTSAPSEKKEASPAPAPVSTQTNTPAEEKASTPTSKCPELSEEQNQVLEIGSYESNVYHCNITIDDNCVMKFPRVFMLTEKVNEKGRVLFSIPSMEDLEDEKFESSFDLYIVSEDNIQNVKQQLLGITDVVKVNIHEWNKESGCNNTTEEGSDDISSHYKNLSDNLKIILQENATTSEVFMANITLDSECMMKHPRAYMCVQAISDNGKLLFSNPNAQDLEEEKFESSFQLYYTTFVENKVVLESLTNIVDVVKVETVNINSLLNDGKPEINKSEPKQEETNTAPAPAPAPAPAAPTTAPAKATATPDKAKKVESNQTVRVDVTRLDNLMNLVGELVIDRTRISQIKNDLAQTYKDPHIENLSETIDHIARITSDLQDQIMKARMMPIDTVLNRFPRVIRDLAQKLGKEVKFQVSGGETELDRSVLEVIGDPLLHILRNSLDHGLEMPDDREKAGKPRTGIVEINARHQENHIVIEIIDDGAGIDVERVKTKAISSGLITEDIAEKMSQKEALQLIFSSGLSTAKQVSEVSGRGVGMDIVRSNIQKLGGLVDLDTTLGTGSTFTLKLPLTLAIIRGLLVNVSSTTYVLPLGSVIETILLNKDDIQTVSGREVIILRGETTPLLWLSETFCCGTKEDSFNSENQCFVVIVAYQGSHVGLVVDNLVGEQEVVIKSLSDYCGDVRGITGATILGNGNVALIADVNQLTNMQVA